MTDLSIKFSKATTRELQSGFFSVPSHVIFLTCPQLYQTGQRVAACVPAALALDNHGNGHSLSTHHMLGPELPLSQSYKVGSVITLTDEKTYTRNSS